MADFEEIYLNLIDLLGVYILRGNKIRGRLSGTYPKGVPHICVQRHGDAHTHKKNAFDVAKIEQFGKRLQQRVRL